MYYRCIAESIGLESVLEEAKSYMQSKKFHPAAIAEELESVKLFWREHKKPSAKKVWLIYWDSPNDSRPIEDRVISIFSIRKSSQEISKFVEEYYKAHSYSLSAKLAFATISSKVDKFRPNKTVGTERFGFKLECGDDPKIRAQAVDNVKVTMVDGKPHLSWTEIKIRPEILSMLNSQSNNG